MYRYMYLRQSEPGVSSGDVVINSVYDKYLMSVKATYSPRLSQSEFLADFENNMNTMSFKINGNNIGCIDITVSKLPIYKNGKIVNKMIASLNKIQSDESCNIYNNLESGVGTRNMIYTALNVVCYLCKGITEFSLVDTSQKECIKNNSGTNISLSSYYIALYGKTWYESILNARLEDQSSYENYTQNLLKLKNKSIVLPWNDLIERVKELKTTKNKEILERIYKSSETYQEFFNNLKIAIPDKEELCLTLRGWLEKFIYTCILDSNISSKTWIFRVSDIPQIEFYKPWLIYRDQFKTEKEFYSLIGDMQKKKLGYRIV